MFKFMVKNASKFLGCGLAIGLTLIGIICNAAAIGVVSLVFNAICGIAAACLIIGMMDKSASHSVEGNAAKYEKSYWSMTVFLLPAIELVAFIIAVAVAPHSLMLWVTLLVLAVGQTSACLALYFTKSADLPFLPRIGTNQSGEFPANNFMYGRIGSAGPDAGSAYTDADNGHDGPVVTL